MLNNFIKIRWRDTKKSLWINDYIHDDDNNYCVLSTEEKSDQFSFILSKSLVKDILSVLNEAIIVVCKIENFQENVRVINLGFDCKNNLISGKFSIYQNDTS